MFLPATIILISSKWSHFSFVSVFKFETVATGCMFLPSIHSWEWGCVADPWDTMEEKPRVMVPFSCPVQSDVDANSIPSITEFASFSCSTRAGADSAWRAAEGMGEWEEWEGIGDRSFAAVPGSEAMHGAGPSSRIGPQLPERVHSLKSLWHIPLMGRLWFFGCKLSFWNEVFLFFVFLSFWNLNSESAV